MKRSLFFLLSLCGASILSAESEEQIQGTLIFPDGDSIVGLPSGMNEAGLLLWKSPLFLAEKAPFRTTAIDSIRLDTKPPRFSAEGEGEGEEQEKEVTIATLTFQSRIDQIFDVMEAELLDFDEKEVHIKTWYAGDMTLQRSMLHSIEVMSEAPALVNGPGRMDQWQKIESPAAWRLEGKNLISSDRGSIAREFPNLPNRIKLEFDLEFSYSPYLRLHFFSDSGEVLIPRNGYSLSIQRGSMQFLKKVNNGSVPLKMERFGGRFDFQEQDPDKISIFIDRAAGSFALYIDDKKVTTATDPDPLMDDNWWHLSTLHDREQTISNFAIRPWDGELPKRDTYLDFRQELPVLGEQIELHNGDTIVGKATSITEGKLGIETEYVEVSVPIARLRSFQVTSDEEHSEPKIYNGDVRAHFHHGGHVTLRLSEMTNTSITGFSQVFGEASFDLRAFSHIDFNVYDPEFRVRRGLPY